MDLNAWQEEIQAATEELKLQRRVWKKTLMAYRGIDPDELDLDDKLDTVNHVLPMVNRMIPRLVFKDPSIQMIPTVEDPVIIEGAPAVGAYIEQLLAKLKVNREMRRCVKDMFYYGEAWMKLGYTASFQSMEEAKEQIGAADPAFPKEVSNELRGRLLEAKSIEGSEVAFDDRLVAETLFAMRVLPPFMLHDPDAIELTDCRWLAHVVPKRVEEVRNSSKYNRSVAMEIAGGKRFRDFLSTEEEGFGEIVGRSKQRNLRSEDDDWVAVIEVWDKQNGEVLVLTPDSKDWLRDPRPWPYKMEGYPFKRLQFNEDPERWWGDPEIKIWMPLVKDLNFYRRKRNARIKANNYKWIGSATAFADDQARDSLFSSVDGEYVPVALDEGQNIKNTLYRVDPATTPPDIGLAEARAKEDLSNVSAISEQRRGTQGTYTTATEVSIIEGGLQEYEADRGSLIEDFYRDVVRGLLSLTRQYVSPDEVVAAIGPQGYKFYRVTGSLVEHEYIVGIVVGSTKYVSEEQMIGRMTNFFQLAYPTGMLDIPPFLQDLGDKLLGVTASRYLLDPTDPEGLRKASLLAAARQVMGITEAPQPQMPEQQGQNGNALNQMQQGGISGAPNTLTPPEFSAATRGQGGQ